MKFLLLLLILSTSLLARALLAQSDEQAEAVEIPFYDVEIVIFKNNQGPKSKEFVLPVSSPPKDEKLLELSSSGSVAAAKKLGYKLLPTVEYRLIDVVTKLVNSPRYELLSYIAWRQPGLERKQVLPIWIKGGRIYGEEYTSIDNQFEFLDYNRLAAEFNQKGKTSFEFNEQSLEALELQMMERPQSTQHGGLYELEGKITIALSRYLHTYADLVLRRPRLSADPAINTSSQGYPAYNSADTHILNNHSLKEHRRMRSKNLHYLDNPEFSMLILITPFEVPKDLVEEPIEDEPVDSE